MTPQSPHRYRGMAIAVVVVAVVIGSGIDLAISLARSVSTSSTSTICTIPDSGELLLRVVNSSNGQPVGSLPVQVEDYYPNCIPPSFRDLSTNSSGMVLIGGTADDYSLTVDFHGQNFTAGTYIGPGELTCVTLDVPSGDFIVSPGNLSTSCATPTPVSTSTVTANAGETCTPAATVTQGSSTETITLCHTTSTTYAPPTSTTSTSSTTQLYQLEFVQESNCPYGSWLVPWAVMLDNQTAVTQPSNATLPLTYAGARLTSDSSYSTISFSVLNGTYSYTILPKNLYGVEENGTVTVNGANVEVRISAFVTAMGCSTTSTGG